MTALASFTVRAKADPQILVRLLNYFAQLGETPRRVIADIDAEATVTIEVAGLRHDQLSIIAEKMRASVHVSGVVLSSNIPLTSLGEQPL